MHLDGYDYDIPCPKCGGTTRMNLNILWAMHFDHGKLSEDQIEQLQLPIKSTITVKNIRKYQEKFTAFQMSKSFKANDLEYIVHLRTGSIDTKMESYGLMFNLLEKQAREAVAVSGVTNKASIDSKCQELLTRMWHLHYLPIISHIDIVLPTGTKTAKRPAVVLQLLKNLSVADETGELAMYLTDFSYDNVVTFGTHVPDCTSCGHKTEELRGFDPVIDFFIRQMSRTLSTSIVQEVMMKS